MADIGHVLSEALDRQYVIYRLEDYGQLRDKFGGYLGNPQEIGSQAVRTAIASQVQAQAESARLGGQEVAGMIQFWEELGKGNVLNNILNEIAGIMDSKVQAAWSAAINSFSSAITDAHSSKGIFTESSIEAEQLNKFFRAIEQGISVMTNGNVPQSVFYALTGIGATLTGDKGYSYTGSQRNVPQPITQEQLKAVNDIIGYLRNAANKYEQKGPLSIQSITSTLNNIFGRRLGEMLLTNIFQSAIGEVVTDLDNKFKNANIAPNIRVVEVSGTGSEFSNIGSLQKKGGGTTKIDILNTNGLTLSVSYNDQIIDLAVSTNASVKWKNTRSELLPKDFNISLGSMQLGSILNGQHGTSLGNRGAIYNVIAHDGDGTNAQKLRSTIAASFLSEYLAGSGSTLAKRGDVIDKVQLFAINGRVYSVTDIISRAIGQAASFDQGTGLTKYLNMTFPTGGNKWVGEDGVNNWKYAYSRSKAFRDAANKIRVGLTLDMRILSRGLT